MATAPINKAPPYASYTSFQNYLEYRRGTPLPSRIDKSVMSHLNYGTRQALMAALRGLVLIDDNDAPTDRFDKLITASDDERKAILVEAAREAYPYFWDGSIDLTKTTPGEFQQLIRDSTSATGTTVDKACAFFFGLAADAGIELSPHLTSRKPGGGSSPAKRAKPRQKKPKPPANEVDNPGDDPKPGGMAQSLLDKFPNMDPTWPADLQAKWFSAFEKLMKSAEKAGQL
jgi:hypothetical protein